MQFEVAMVLNIHKELSLRADKSKQHIMSTNDLTYACIALDNYLHHRGNIIASQANLIYNKLDTEHLPYPVSKPKLATENNIAVDIDGSLLLLHWCSTPAKRDEWSHRIKKLAGARVEEFNYNKDTIPFEWCDVTYDNVSYLKVAGWKVYTDFKRVKSLSSIDISKLDKRLFPYQIEGVKMLNTGFRLMADEQGLGKTCQVLQYLGYVDATRILICCPSTLKLNWAKEIRMWTDTTPDRITILNGTKPYKVTGKYVIINYDILVYWMKTLDSMNWDFVVADECHYVQNETAQRTKAFTQIVKKADDSIFISGTPFTSRPYQMYTALHNIAPKIFRTQQEYGQRFCDPKFDGMKWTYKGASNMDVLHSILMDGICIRRLKSDVLKDLPEKMRVVLPVCSDMNYIKTNHTLMSQIRELEDKINKASSSLATLEYQKQIAYLMKSHEINKWIADFLESGKKLVVFGVHTNTLDTIMSEFSDVAVRVDGSTPQKERERAINAFQTDDGIKLFVGNIRACGTGITLTAASDVLITEYDWSFATMIQAEDRIHRIGAKECCQIHYMVCPNSIDEKVITIINKKAAQHQRIFDAVHEDNLINILRSEGGCEYRSVL